ncbi:MAG: PH domain-containing protein [Cytophagales bacterium]
MGLDLLAKFSVTKIENKDDSSDKVQEILADGEQIVKVYSHTRDKVWFTNKRIIALDVQGLTGSKKEYRSFPYNKISSFSIETAGTFDGDSDFKIWVSGVGVFEIKFHRKLDIKQVAKYLSNKVM